MGKVNSALAERIEDLCDTTGYSFEFLMARYQECVDMDLEDPYAFFEDATIQYYW